MPRGVSTVVTFVLPTGSPADRSDVRVRLFRSHAADEAAAKEVVRRFDLTDVASRVSAPLYVVAGTRDGLTPSEGGVRIAEEAQGPTVLDVIEDGNHVVNNMPYRYRPQVADWMVEQIG